ncbi:MAG TPA: hypothetical protein VKQ72_13375 [Aggregatilineales bacterium]|nr:hypothetical protein [Aggregatilineales bacterium]
MQFMKSKPVEGFMRVTSARCGPVFLVLALVTLSACGSSTPEAPHLLSAQTIAPGTKGALIPTDVPTLTPSETPTDVPSLTDAPPTPTYVPTWTLAPTETPTDTPTASFTPSPYLSPTRTPRPTRTITPSASPPTPTPLPCTLTWYFSPRPFNCPLSAKQTGSASYQPFEHGFMIYFEPGNVIFAAFDSGRLRWGQYTNTWQNGMPDSDPTIAAPQGMFQPVRGFGLVWRGQVGVRDRLGWATAAEASYQGALQIDTDGNRYVQGPSGEVYALSADFKRWMLAH